MNVKSAERNSEITRRALAVIPTNVLVHVMHYADQHGVDPRRWLAGLGLTREQLLDPQVRLSYRQARTILLRALDSFGQPGLGLIVGISESLGVFGLLGLMMTTAPTFGEAVRLAVDNHEVSGSLLDVGLELGVNGDAALLVWPRFDDPVLQPFLCEELMASSLAIARELVGAGFCLRRVELAYAEPAHAPMYRRMLGCETDFGAATSRMVLDAAWLDAPLPGYNPLIARQMLDLCRAQRQRVQHFPEREIVASVERLLRAHLPENLHVQQVAQWLNLSERSLRRRLAGAGRAFREISDEVRTERALEMLRGGAARVTDVASAVGFSDAREFRRAFKRWTGIAPQAAREGRTPTHFGRIATP